MTCLRDLEGCCGIGELYDFRVDKEDVIPDVFNAIPLYREEWGEPSNVPVDQYGIIVFTDNITYPGGKTLAKFIRSKKLGRLVSSSVVSNPNHDGNKIMMWTWYPNYPALRRIKKTLDKR